ncbi:uncharacterized protein LOC129761447 [Toxorhynchites rutilus septentrionalis]|nr:uncharacterized protein LOC129761447 [Toxorhynchites rutilus septentrionalis]
MSETNSSPSRVETRTLSFVSFDTNDFEELADSQSTTFDGVDNTGKDNEQPPFGFLLKGTDLSRVEIKSLSVEFPAKVCKKGMELNAPEIECRIFETSVSQMQERSTNDMQDSIVSFDTNDLEGSTKSQDTTYSSDVDVTELVFNTTDFENLRKEIKEKGNSNRIKYNVKVAECGATATKRLYSGASIYECSFYINKKNIEMCKHYDQHNIMQSKTKVGDAKYKQQKHRRPFIVALEDLLKIKYEEFNIYCIININSHNCNKSGWLFYGVCAHKTCRSYRFKIVSVTDGDNIYKVDVYVNVAMTLIHGENLKAAYCKGVKRNINMKKLQLQKPLELRTKLINEKKKREPFEKVDIVSKNVLKKISSEAKSKLNRDIDDFQDLIKMSEDNGSYIKNVFRKPFGVICFNTKMFKELRKNKTYSPIFYMDGTGSVVRYSKAEKRVQIYVLVAYNYRSNFSVPVTTFVTESQKTVDFHNWLNIFRASYESGSSMNKLNKIARIVSVDWSWSLIGGLIRALNNQHHTLPEYIRDCYKVCIRELNLNFTIIHLCYSHFMNVVSKDLKSAPINIKHKFMDCMRLAVRATNLVDLIDLFIIMTCIFGSANENRMLETSLKELDAKINDRTSFDSESAGKFDYTGIGEPEILKKDEDKIFLGSPFYALLKETFETTLKQIDDLSQGSQNPLYFKGFLEDVALKKYMPVVCLWSNIIVSQIDSNPDTISNARVESFFRTLKHNVMKGQLYERITHFLRKLQSYIESLFHFSDFDIEDIYATDKGISNAKKRQDDRIAEYDRFVGNVEDIEDEWHSPYFQKDASTHLFKKKKKQETNSLNTQLEQSTQKHPDSKENSDNNRKRSLEEDLETTCNLSSIHQFIDKGFEFPVTTKWYFGEFPSEYESIGVSSMIVSSEMLQTLDAHTYMDGETLDAIIAVAIKECEVESVKLVSTYMSRNLFDTTQLKEVLDRKRDYVLPVLTNTSGVWVVPLNVRAGQAPTKQVGRGNHWVLFIADFMNRETFYLDPLETASPYLKDVQEEFLKAVSSIRRLKNQPFDSTNWQSGSKNIAHDKQNDDYNCGVYVAKYAQNFLLKKPLTGLGNMDSERKQIKIKLLNTAVIKICLYCSSLKSLILSCQSCGRRCCSR